MAAGTAEAPVKPVSEALSGTAGGTDAQKVDTALTPAEIAKNKRAEQAAAVKKANEERLAKKNKDKEAADKLKEADKATKEKEKAGKKAQAAADKKKLDDARAEADRLKKQKADLLAAEKAKREQEAAEKKRKDDEFLALTTEEKYTPAPLTEAQMERRTLLEEQARAEGQTAALHAHRMGEVVRQILEEGLHRDCATAAVYVEKAFGWSRSKSGRELQYGHFVGERLAIASKVQPGEDEEPVYYQYPENASLVRPLQTLANQSLMHKVWDKVVKDCKKRSAAENKVVKPTAKDVQKFVDEEKGKGSVAVGLDKELEDKAIENGKMPKGGAVWRRDIVKVQYLVDKGRRYQVTLIGQLFKAAIFNESDGLDAEPIVSKVCSTNEQALLFWDQEKATFDQEEDDAFNMPKAEYFDPATGDEIAPGEGQGEEAPDTEEQSPDDETEAWSE